MRPGPLVLCAMLVSAPAAAQDGGAAPTVAIAAGFDGYYTVGRWMPVRVDAEAQSADFTGDLSVTWGAASYRQALSLPSPSRRRIEFYVRAADLRDSVRVELRGEDGGVVAAREVPVRGVLPAEPLHVFVGPFAGSTGGVHAAFVAPADLPVSWRGYDGADEVRVDGAAPLTPAQARALQRWRAVRDLDETSELRREIGRLAGSGTPDTNRWRFAALYVGLLLLIAAVLPRLTRRAAALHGALVVAAAGCAAVPAAGLLDAVVTAGRVVRPRTTDAGTFESSLTVARMSGRSVAVVTVPGVEQLLEAAPDAPPHEIRYDESGGAAFAIAGSDGEAFSIIARGFASLHDD